MTVNAVSPGYFVNTTIYRNMRGAFRYGSFVVFGIGSLLGLNTPEKGARTHIWCASSPELEGVTGQYFAYCRVGESSALAKDETIRKRIWAWSEQATGIAA